MDSASSRFLDGFGYGSFKYDSRKVFRVRSLKQCDFCSPSQIVDGKGCFLRTRYLSTEINNENCDQKNFMMFKIDICVKLNVNCLIKR